MLSLYIVNIYIIFHYVTQLDKASFYFVFPKQFNKKSSVIALIQK